MAYTGTFTLQDYNDAGASGLNTAVAILYKRSATQPTKPSTTTTFTFSTGGMTGQNNGWTQSIPASDGNPLWVIQAVASAIAPAPTDTIPAEEWSAPVKIVENGTPGSPGYNSAVIYLYQRAVSTPVITDISDPITYTFATKAITSYPTSTGAWTTTIPAGTDPLYVIVATASSNTSTDTIARSEWGTPVVLSQNGEDGGEIPQQTDPPTPLVLGMLWLDTNSTPAILRRCISTSATEFSEIWEALNPSYDEMVEAINNIDIQLSNEAISYTPKDKMYILYQWRTTEVAYQNILARVNSSSFKSVIIGSDGTLQDALTALTTIRDALIVNLDLLDILTSTGSEDLVGLSETTVFTNNNYVATFASLHSQMEKIQKMFVDLPSQILKLEEGSLVIDRTKLVNINGSVLVNGSVVAEKINVKGLNVTDGSGAITLTISETGDIVMKGIVYASDGEFSGKVTATSGTFSGMVNADGGIFTSAITLNGYLDTGDSGITGVLTDTVRIWAGNTYANRNVAPFRVSNLGYLYAEAAEITGTVNATGGTFTNSIALTGYLTVGSGSQLAGINGAGSSDTDVRFWAGDTYANSGSAKFRVLQNGDLYAENGYFSGTIESNGALSGALTAGNIYIKNNNNWSSTTDLTAGNGWSFAIFPDDSSDEPVYTSYSYLAIEEGIFQQNYNTTFISRPVASLDTVSVADMYAQINSSVQGIVSKNIYSFDSFENTVSKIVGGSFRLFYQDNPTLTSAPNAATEKLRISATQDGSVILSNKMFFLGTGSTYENDPVAFANPTVGFGTKTPRTDNSVTINGGLAILDQLGFYDIVISYVNPVGATVSSNSAKLIAKNTDNGISIDFNM